MKQSKENICEECRHINGHPRTCSNYNKQPKKMEEFDKKFSQKYLEIVNDELIDKEAMVILLLQDFVKQFISQNFTLNSQVINKSKKLITEIVKSKGLIHKDCISKSEVEDKIIGNIISRIEAALVDLTTLLKK